MLQKRPIIGKKFLLIAIAISSLLFMNFTFAGVIHMKAKRSDVNHPITKLEVVALVKSKLKGRILSVKKQRTYKYPDCYHVKLLQNDGEFQLIKVACRK